MDVSPGMPFINERRKRQKDYFRSDGLRPMKYRSKIRFEFRQGHVPVVFMRGVVTSEFDQNDIGLVCKDIFFHPGESLTGGISTDTGVDKIPRRVRIPLPQ